MKGVASVVRGVVTNPGASLVSISTLNCPLLPPHFLPLPLLLSRLAVVQYGISPDNIFAYNHI